MPTSTSPSSTGTRFTRRSSITSAISASEVPGPTVMTLLVMMSRATSPCERTYSWANVAVPVKNASHEPRCFCVPSSARRSRSPSLTSPVTLPSPFSTGTPLIPRDNSSLTISRTGVSSVTVTTGAVMIDAAFMAHLL